MLSINKNLRKQFNPSIEARFWRLSGSSVFLFFGLFIYICVFSAASILTYLNFGMSAFDIGIHDQAIWKIATGHGLFSTVRGLPIWGDHCWFIMIFIAPFYWVWAELEVLLVLQSVALAIGVIPLAAYTYRLTRSQWTTVALSLCWLLSPALQNMNLENFHPEVIAAPFLIWAIERADVKSWGWYSIAVTMALFCKEDVALTVMAVGVWVFFTQDRRAGVLTVVAGMAWFIFCMKLVLPFFNDAGFFRFESGYWFSTFWNNKFSPEYYWNVLGTEQVRLYVWQLGLPVLFLGIFSPLLLLAALPSFLINVLSGNDYLISIHYHYNFQTLPIIFAATASTLAWIGSRGLYGRAIMMLICASMLSVSVYANNEWSDLPLKRIHSSLKAQYNNFTNGQWNSRFQGLAEYLPSDVETPLSVSHNLLPHLAHRAEVYMYPNPFYPVYWGIKGENLPSPERIMWIMVDTNTLDKDSHGLLMRLLQTGEFVLVQQLENMLVAKRNTDSEQAAVIDPINAELNGNSIHIFAYVSDNPVTSIDPLPIRVPDIHLATEAIEIPLTTSRLLTREGLDLGAADNIHVVFNGKWIAKGEEDVIFQIRADDGCRLYLNGKELIDYSGVHSFGGELHTRQLRLEPGQHQIALQYFEWGGEAGVQVEWASAANREFKLLSVGDELP